MLTVATYNIHKGFSTFNQRVVLHALRERLHNLNADIVFLQEVQGEHNFHLQQHADYPEGGQHEFIADRRWPHSAYGKNSIYAAGHHGNAILSRFPIIQTLNTDISAHRFESRGLLHGEVQLEGGLLVHCLCAHFGLFAKGRRSQTAALIDYVRNEIPADAPVIIAGDFNDWRNQMSAAIAAELGMHDVFNLHSGDVARSFPARMPMFRLDRIYVRGFTVRHSAVHVGGAWQRLSDHAALSASLSFS
jgi:endonuclease/exonuclease/phosphatase family metal-dependent hydrolase